MIDSEVAYLLISLFAIISSLLIFMQKKLLHAALALTMAFLASALLFAAIGQAFIGLLQLLIFVGGLSAYLIAAVATEVKGRSMIRPLNFAVTAVALSIALTLMEAAFPVYAYQATTFPQAAPALFSADYILLFVLAFMLFSTAMGGVLIIKKFRKLVI